MVYVITNEELEAMHAQAKRIQRAERYDYTVQAWIGTDGRYLCCSHPDSMNCGCYGKAHHGELASVGHSIH
jgi:hypothetical protein